MAKYQLINSYTNENSCQLRQISTAEQIEGMQIKFN